jgi:hypothetical protein
LDFSFREVSEGNEQEVHSEAPIDTSSKYKNNEAKMAHGMTNTRMIKSKMEITISKMKIQDGVPRWRSKMEDPRWFKMEFKMEIPRWSSKMEIQDGDPRWRSKMEVQDGDPRWRSKMKIQDGDPRWRSKMEIQDGDPDGSSRWR